MEPRCRRDCPLPAPRRPTYTHFMSAERPRFVARGLIVALLAFAPMGLVACGPATPTAHGPVRPAAAWTGEDVELFDDGIDVGAVPMPGTSEGKDDGNDARIASRTTKADGVVVGKVIGVSSEPVGEKNRYRLELLVEGEPLAGAKPDSPFTLIVENTAPAFGTVRSQDAQLIGKKFVVFFRRYAAEEGADEPITHYHLSAAIPRIVEQVNNAATRKKVEDG